MGRTRIAPTPSGYLHTGNAINFLVTTKLAKENGFRLRLRIDDLDAERVRPEYVTDIFSSLVWLGIEIDEGPLTAEDHFANYSQNQRLQRYQAFADELRALSVVYGCTCSRTDLRMDLEAGKNTCDCRYLERDLDAPECAWRLRIPAATFVKINGITGNSVTYDLSASGDPVIRSRQQNQVQQRVAYQIASLADDVDLGITHIVRGTDLLESTAFQLHIAELLGLNSFLNVRFLHHALEMDANGNKLSKSAGATSLKAMIDAGLTPEILEYKANTLFSL